ncbi:MAG: efflux RND transporter periplasmic adaptor subunit [Terriglobales bacterium]
MKHFLFVFAGVLACVLGIFVAQHVRAGVGTPATAVSHVPRAVVAVVKKQPISNSLTVAGEFFPYQEVEIHAKVAGYIKKIGVDIGDHVHTGQVLAELEIPELGAQVQGADASVRHSQEEITHARNEVSRAEADHAALHSAADRLQKAAAARPGLVAEQEIDDAIAKDRSSEAQVEAAKSALSAAQQQLEVSRASRSQVGALWDYSHIVAPFDGVVTWRYADTGALVQAGTSNASAQPVVKLAEVNMLRLRVPVPEAIAASIHIGSPAEITVQATREHFTAKVSRLTDSLDRSTRTEQVEFDIPNRDMHLAPGMYAEVVLQVQHDANALTVPVQAMERNAGKSNVLVVDSSNRVNLRDVSTGIESPTSVEVTSGLKEGDRVIVGNLGAYQPGQLVDPKPSSIADAQLATAGGQ